MRAPIATDGNSEEGIGRPDGLWGVETAGPPRGQSQQSYAVPAGAELCVPTFTPDDETLFIAIQHLSE